jgi:hypothetical protein
VLFGTDGVNWVCLVLLLELPAAVFNDTGGVGVGLLGVTVDFSIALLEGTDGFGFGWVETVTELSLDRLCLRLASRALRLVSKASKDLTASVLLT